MTLKNTTPTIDKKLVDSKGDGTYTPNTQPDYAVGDDVYYELTSTVPVYTGYDIDSTMKDATKTRIFKINDTASKALTVSAGTVIESVKLTPAQVLPSPGQGQGLHRYRRWLWRCEHS